MTIIKLFICKNCLFSCGFESDYKRHIKTKKHAKNVDLNNINCCDDGPHFPTKNDESSLRRASARLSSRRKAIKLCGVSTTFMHSIGQA